jgi:kynurenine formamidase
MRRTWVTGLAVAAAAAGATAGSIAGPSAQDGADGGARIDFDRDRLVDLSHAFDRRTIYWPTARRFRLTKVAEGETEGGWFYAANNFSAAEHGGTHLDAPVHFARGGDKADEIPLRRLAGAAVTVDVRARARADRDLLIGVADLEAHERREGAIPRGAIVLLRTGWGSRWPDARRYLGTAQRGERAVVRLHFPGLAAAAARWLVEERQIKAVGIDTASIDRGQSTMFESHRVLGAAGVPVFENVAELDELPADGFHVVALPMKIAGGSGGPLRAMAVIPRDG